MRIEDFGTLKNGDAVKVYTLKNEALEARVMDRGATVVSLTVAGRDVVGGFDSISAYEIDDSHQGALIGRVANRIEKGVFTMDGVTYKLPINNGENCLHGGEGFDYKIWRVLEYSDEKITLEYISQDGEEGFPGTLTTKVSSPAAATAAM